MTKPNFTSRRFTDPRPAIEGYSEGAIPAAEALKGVTFKGNTLVIDADSRVYNTHPLTRQHTDHPGEAIYPIRWQIASAWDLSPDLAAALGLDYEDPRG